MKYYGKAKQVADQIVENFKAGNLPAALAQVFIHRDDDVPCRAWSWSNQMVTALVGRTHDARGFKQWQRVGRKVNKGAKAFHILAPCLRTIEEEEEVSPGQTRKTERQIVVGFRSVPVFRIEDTSVSNHHLWDKASKASVEAQAWIQALPLVGVAKAWGLDVTTYNGAKAGAKGYYKHGTAIALGVENLSTWAHELVHAADFRTGKLVKSSGQNKGNEVVAEFGGAIVLNMLGLECDADLGGAWEYITSYCDGERAKVVKYIVKMIDRTCEAVELIWSEAEKVEPETVEEVAAEVAGLFG